ncbi:MAG: type II toxin-antitoxin system VapC family toxin [Candidatus Nanopelagicales bacterium]
MPEGTRLTLLRQSAAAIWTRFAGSILPFDQAAGSLYGTLKAFRDSQGRPTGILDAQIAAIALTRGHALASRNITDLETLGLNLIDP